MAPKKKAAKGKGGDDEGPDQGEMAGILEAHADALKQKLVMQQERMNASMAKQERIQKAEEQMDVDMQKHKVDTQEMVKNMTSAYRSMEEDLLKTIKKNEDRANEQDKAKSELKEEIARLQVEQDEMEKNKDAEIKQLKEQLDEVSSDFANLLKNQLEKFKQRVVQGHNSFEQAQEMGVDADD